MFLPSLNSHQLPLGSLEPPGFCSGPTVSEPQISILLRQRKKERLPKFASIERPSTSRDDGGIPAISHVVGIKSVRFTSAWLLPLLTPGPFTKKGTSELSQ